MARMMMKRLTAMALALILILGQVALPVIADEGNTPPADFETVNEVKDGDGNVIGEETVGQSTVKEPVYDGEGKQIGEKTDVTQYKEGYTAVPGNGGVDTHEWEEEVTDSETKTKTESTKEDQIIDKPEGWTGDWAEEWDEDEKIIRDDPTTTDPDADELDDLLEDEDNEDWEEGETLNDDDPFTDPETTVGGEEQTVTTPKETVISQTLVVPYDHMTNDAGDDIEIFLTPNGQTVSVPREVSLDDIKAGLYPEIYDPNAEMPEGCTQKVEELIEGDQFKGWLVTVTQITVGDPYQVGDIVDGLPTFVVDKDGGIAADVDEVQRYEELIAKGGSETGIDKNGQTVITTVKKFEKDGKEAYREIRDTIVKSETTTSYEDIDDTTHPDVVNGPTTTKTFAPPPAAPQETTTYNADGSRTEVRVTPLYDQTGELALAAGDEVGYTVSTVTYDKDGNVMESAERDVYGTRTETTITVTKDPVTKQTDTTTTIIERCIQELYAKEFTRTATFDQTLTQNQVTTTDTTENQYKLVESGDNMYFVYSATMTPVTDNSKTGVDYSLASANMVLNPDGTVKKDANGNVVLENSTVLLDGTDLRIKDELGVVNNYTGQTGTFVYNEADGTWQKIGTGLYGGFLTWDDKEGRHTPQQYMICDGTEIRFVYCVELNKSISTQDFYTPKHMEEGSDELVWTNHGDGKPAVGTAAEVGIVATHGFWGTREGLGSMAAVKELLIKHGYSDEADRLTEGIAMAATQLALWEFGNTSTGAGFTAENGDYVKWDDSRWDPDKKTWGNWAQDLEQSDIHTLRNLLIGLADGTIQDVKVEPTEEIKGEKITGGSIVVKETVYENGQIKKDTEGNAAYVTDMKFKLDVSTNSITGNLTVKIMDKNNKVLAKARLAGNDENDSLWDTVLNLGTIRPVNGVYTLEGVELFAGQSVTVKLEGIQMLEDGVYIYQNVGSQDFVGLATETKNIDISFGMSLEVKDPELQLVTDGKTVERTDTITSTREQKRVDTIKLTFTDTKNQQVEQVHKKETVLGTETTVTETLERTRAARRWNRYGHYDITTTEDEDFGGGVPVLMNLLEDPVPLAHDPVGALEILDEGVPLADAPATGDASMIWGILGMLSLSGSSLLTRKEKKVRKGGKFLKN